jgi:hypothetical protein
MEIQTNVVPPTKKNQHRRYAVLIETLKVNSGWGRSFDQRCLRSLDRRKAIRRPRHVSPSGNQDRDSDHRNPDIHPEAGSRGGSRCSLNPNWLTTPAQTLTTPNSQDQRGPTPTARAWPLGAPVVAAVHAIHFAATCMLSAKRIPAF